MRSKSIIPKVIASVIVASMSVALIPKITGSDKVLAWNGEKNDGNTFLGTSKIAAPVAPTDYQSEWTGSYVNIGYYNGQLLKYRVLDPNTTAYGGNTMLLDCDKVIFEHNYDDEYNEWESSDLRNYLNSTFLTETFSPIEQSAIAKSTIGSHEYVVGDEPGQVSSWIKTIFHKYTPLTGEKIFILDAEELCNPAYGYYNVDYSSYTRLKDGMKGFYWFRGMYTKGSEYYSGFVDSDFDDCDDGDMYYEKANYTAGVAPAMNIDLSKVLFSTADTYEPGVIGASYYLTFLDPDITVSVPTEEETYSTGDYIWVPYSISGAHADDVTSVMILILDKEYGTEGAEILYYDGLSAVYDLNGRGSFTLPSGLSIDGWNKDYYVYITAENLFPTEGGLGSEYSSAPCKVNAPKVYSGVVGITGGKAHVQDVGDVSVLPDSAGVLTIGTKGEGKRLEAITINFENDSAIKGDLQYRVHVQDIGWMDWVNSGQTAGTEGLSKRIEAIEIRLTGELGSVYSVEYCVHIQDYGDMQGWVKDGAIAGTTGESKRIEELKIRLVCREGVTAPLSVKYRVHVQDYGWESAYASDGAMSGTSGQSKRLEGIEIFISGCQYAGGVRYKTHIQDYGWESTWLYDGEMSGTQGESKRLEGICIELYGEMNYYYDIYYRVHAQDIGWLGWAKNGANAGTAGRSARLEGIQIVLVPKGSPAPGTTYQGITSVTDVAFVEGF